MWILQKAQLASQPLSLLWLSPDPTILPDWLLFEGLSREEVSIWKARMCRLRPRQDSELVPATHAWSSQRLRLQHGFGDSWGDQ